MRLNMTNSGYMQFYNGWGNTSGCGWTVEAAFDSTWQGLMELRNYVLQSHAAGWRHFRISRNGQFKLWLCNNG